MKQKEVRQFTLKLNKIEKSRIVKVRDFFIFINENLTKLKCYDRIYLHQRTVHRSVGDSKLKLAGRLSDKMSSELGIRVLRCRVFLFFGGIYEKHKG